MHFNLYVDYVYNINLQSNQILDLDTSTAVKIKTNKICLWAVVV